MLAKKKLSNVCLWVTFQLHLLFTFIEFLNFYGSYGNRSIYSLLSSLHIAINDEQLLLQTSSDSYLFEAIRTIYFKLFSFIFQFFFENLFFTP